MIRISNEQALIVWDSVRHHEDFIRRADFVTNADRFGFLVPVPSTPTLTEADDHVFDVLYSNEEPPRKSVGLGGALRGADATAGVDVIRQQKVAGYEASILAADDATVLHQWLRENGYSTPDGFEQWAQPYIDEHWKIVAFKMSDNGVGAAPSGVSSKLVRISFDTDRPFYPYREPLRPVKPSDAAHDRKLVVYFLSSTVVSAKIGPANTAWVGRAYAVNHSISNDVLSSIAKDLKMDVSQLPAHPELTTFIDTSSPRNGWADVWFDPQPKTANAR
jgi:hypothetical protein